MKGWGKSPPRPRRRGRHGKPRRPQDRIGLAAPERAQGVSAPPAGLIARGARRRASQMNGYPSRESGGTEPGVQAIRALYASEDRRGRGRFMRGPRQRREREKGRHRRQRRKGHLSRHSASPRPPAPKMRARRGGGQCRNARPAPQPFVPLQRGSPSATGSQAIASAVKTWKVGRKSSGRSSVIAWKSVSCARRSLR